MVSSYCENFQVVLTNFILITLFFQISSSILLKNFNNIKLDKQNFFLFRIFSICQNDKKAQKIFFPKEKKPKVKKEKKLKDKPEEN